jgi:hypothetical protein
MTTPTMKSGSAGTGTPSDVVATGRGSGMTMFAAVVLGVLGFFNLLDGIAAIADSRVFVSNTVYVIGDLHSWGWTVAVLGGLQLLAAFGVAAGNQVARWFGVAVVGLNAIAQMFFITAYPFWSLMIIAIDIVAIYALCIHGGRDTAR